VTLRVARWAAGELTRAVPPEWIYGALGVGAVMYATLFGLGAAGYRMLFIKHETAGDFAP
jgi:hypothetical protein